MANEPRAERSGISGLSTECLIEAYNTEVERMGAQPTPGGGSPFRKLLTASEYLSTNGDTLGINVSVAQTVSFFGQWRIHEQQLLHDVWRRLQTMGLGSTEAKKDLNVRLTEKCGMCACWNKRPEWNGCSLSLIQSTEPNQPACSMWASKASASQPTEVTKTAEGTMRSIEVPVVRGPDMNKVRSCLSRQLYQRSNIK